MITQITIPHLAAKMETGLGDEAILIDVRNNWEYKAKHIPGAVNIPLAELESHKDELSKYNEIYFQCQSGGRSGRACDVMTSLGLDNAINVEGGLMDWEENGFPIESST